MSFCGLFVAHTSGQGEQRSQQMRQHAMEASTDRKPASSKGLAWCLFRMARNIEPDQEALIYSYDVWVLSLNVMTPHKNLDNPYPRILIDTVGLFIRGVNVKMFAFPCRALPHRAACSANLLRELAQRNLLREFLREACSEGLAQGTCSKRACREKLSQRTCSEKLLGETRSENLPSV